MPLRRRGPGLVRTAAVVGTATAVSGSVSRHQQQKYAAQDQAQAQAQAEQQYYAPPPPSAAPAPPVEDVTVQISKLASLHDQGILTDEEFATAKAKLLG